MNMTAEKEERHKENMLRHVGECITNMEQDDPAYHDAMWSAKERSIMEAEAFVLWYQVNQ